MFSYICLEYFDEVKIMVCKILQEFKFMKKSRLDSAMVSAYGDTASDISQTSSKSEKFFEKFLEKGSPFDAQKEEDDREDVFDTEVRNYHW